MVEYRNRILEILGKIFGSTEIEGQAELDASRREDYIKTRSPSGTRIQVEYPVAALRGHFLESGVR